MFICMYTYVLFFLHLCVPHHTVHYHQCLCTPSLGKSDPPRIRHRPFARYQTLLGTDLTAGR